jgi:predicted nucleotidyltransferase
MKPSEALCLHREAIRRVVSANRAANPRVFGSTARGEDREGSDLDLLIDPLDGMTLLDWGAIQGALEELLPVSIDVVLSDSLRPAVREAVLREAAAI